jgi:hypothetical protein
VAAHEAVEVGEHVVAHAGEDAVEHTVEHEAETAAEHGAESGACAMSFSADTLITTADGDTHAIASLHVGDRVLAYDPGTGKAKPDPVMATSLHRDANLLDVTLRVIGRTAAGATSATTTTTTSVPASAKQSATGTASEAERIETIHTTANHPWLTADHGWVPAGFLSIGERVVRADGTTAVVAAVRAVRAVPGTASGKRRRARTAPGGRDIRMTSPRCAVHCTTGTRSC